MSDSTLPQIKPYKRHIFLCVGKSCADGRASAFLYQYLKEQLHAKGLHEGPNRIARSKSSCLGICEGGTLAVVYPEGVWYSHLNQEKIDRIIQEHLIEGRPVEEYTFSNDANPNNSCL